MVCHGREHSHVKCEPVGASLSHCEQEQLGQSADSSNAGFGPLPSTPSSPCDGPVLRECGGTSGGHRSCPDAALPAVRQH